MTDCPEPGVPILPEQERDPHKCRLNVVEACLKELGLGDCILDVHHGGEDSYVTCMFRHGDYKLLQALLPGPDSCDECGVQFPDDANEQAGPWHDESCSLHSENSQN